MGREVSLLKTELKAKELSMASEVRKREAAERERDAAMRELEQLRKKRGAASELVQTSQKSMESKTRKLAMENKMDKMKRDVREMRYDGW